MNERKQYVSPSITEVKFEDKNLVMFLSCSKQTKIDGTISDGCCDLRGPFNTTPASAFDPS